MSLNPLTLIEKLIEEHGSSKIQAKHLALLKEEITILQRKFSDLTLKSETLETENKQLRAELQQRAAKIHGLEVAVQKKQSEDRQPPQHDILVLLGKHGLLTHVEIAGHLRLSDQIAKLAITKLKNDRLITYTLPPFNSREPIQYSLSEPGLDYLNDRGQLP